MASEVLGKQKSVTIGLMILKDHTLKLAKIMLTKKVMLRPALATTARVHDADFKNCC